jgi:hypothetical protein
LEIWRRVAAAEELLMKASNRCARFLIAIVSVALGAAMVAPRVAAQDEGWQVTRADYGFKSQRTDVTDLVQDLISRGGVNGRVAVNNQTMGGDPAVGKDKSLRIFAKNRRNQDRLFTYDEGGFVDVRMFVVRSNDLDDRGRTDARYDDRGGSSGARDQDRDRDDRGRFSILRGFYGVQGRTNNVTDLLRGLVRDGALAVNVSNRSMGGDPAVGADKLLIVIYRFQGQEQAAAVPEGSTLSLP